MIVITWGAVTPIVSLQWADLDNSTPVQPSNPTTPNPIAVLIATSGTAAPIEWAERQW